MLYDYQVSEHRVIHKEEMNVNPYGIRIKKELENNTPKPRFGITGYKWTTTIEFGFDKSFPRAWKRAVQDAANKWMAACPNIKIVYNPKQDPLNVKGVRWGYFPKGWVGDEGILAQTSRFGDDLINNPCFTTINGRLAIWKTTGPILTYPTVKTKGKFIINVNGTFLHEWGAVLGMNTNDDPNTTMYHYPHEGEDILSQDDIDGINSIYPTN